MPTAHRHFLAAENYLADCKDSDGDVLDPNSVPTLLAALVHATLALAAAQGANRNPVDRLDTRTISDPPAHGDLIVDQMGATPEAPHIPRPCGAPHCSADYPCDGCRCPKRDTDSDGEPQECVQFANHPDDHIDSDGRYWT